MSANPFGTVEQYRQNGKFLPNIVDTNVALAAPDAITTQDEGVTVGTPAGVTTLNFAGAGVTAVAAGVTTTVTIPGGIQGITTQEESVTTGTAGGVTTLNFAGTGVTAVGVGSATTVTVPNVSDAACTVSRNLGETFSGIIAFPATVHDPLSLYNNGTQGVGGTAGIVIPATGVYSITATIFSSGTGTQILIIKSGSVIAITSSAAASQWYNVAVVYYCTAGDVIQVSASASITTLVLAASVANNFSVVRLS